MSQYEDPVTRLPPNSGGRTPGADDVRVYTWEWGPDQARRPTLPWIGVFLLVFGGLLLLQQLYPQFQAAGSVLVLAIGLAFLIKWALDRGTGSLYAGALITALAVPGLLNGLGVTTDGLSTFSFGVAFLFVALVRAFNGGGIGWQAWLGGLLTIVGAAEITGATPGGWILPIVLVAIGIVLIVQSTMSRGNAP